MSYAAMTVDQAGCPDYQEEREEAGKRLIPVEVKYKHLKQGNVPASLRSFIDKYNPEKAYIINLDLSKTLKIKKTTLSFLPFHELLRQNAILEF